MKKDSNNTIERYQKYMKEKHGVFVDKEQAEIELRSLVNLFLLFKPKTDK